MPRLCSVSNLRIGPGQPLAIIAGPCVLESYELGLQVGKHLKSHCDRLGLPYIFKASFDKANRTSIDSARGPGLVQGLAWLRAIGDELGVPVTTDIHEPDQAEPAARVIDLIQIPAFLCRQTDLLVAAGRSAARHNRAVNVKKGQFISPQEMEGPVYKLAQAGCTNVILTERGTFFGYGRLVTDLLGVAEMMSLKVKDASGAAAQSPPVCFDCTHSCQRPGKGESGKETGGDWRGAPLLARAAVAIGCHALFLETHPEPMKAMSDRATQIPLAEVGGVLDGAAAVARALSSDILSHA